MSQSPAPPVNVVTHREKVAMPKAQLSPDEDEFMSFLEGEDTIVDEVDGGTDTDAQEDTNPDGVAAKAQADS